MANSVCVRGLLAAIGVLAVSWPCAAQVRINEISPVPEEGKFPWVELFVEEVFDPFRVGFAFPSSAGVPVCKPVPAGVPSVPGGKLVVIIFNAAEGELHYCDQRAERWSFLGGSWIRNPPDNSCVLPPADAAEGDAYPREVHVPSSLAGGWLDEGTGGADIPGRSSRGWLAILSECPNSSHSTTPEVLDHVAWGRLSVQDHAAIRRLAPGFHARAVSLSKGFGVEDDRAALGPGDSLGRYLAGPTGVSEFIPFEQSETSQGAPNNVPRPKVFTLPEGATLSGNSASLAWTGNRGDSGYEVRLTRVSDSHHTRVVYRNEDDVTIPVMTFANIPTGDYRLDVSAVHRIANERFESIESSVNWTMVSGPCSVNWNWQVNSESPLEDRVGFPECGLAGQTQCHLIESVEFKFQRKDTQLLCHHPDCEGATGDSLWDRPHPFCRNVVFPQSGETDELCTTDDPSDDSKVARLCRRGAPIATAEAAKAAMRSTSWHGVRYCVPASIAMIASAYGVCISQDRIANAGRSEDSATNLEVELSHGQDFSNDYTTMLLKWVLGLESALRCGATTGVLEPGLELRSQSTTPTASSTDFVQMQSWLDDERPILITRHSSEYGGHAEVVVGYCVDDDEQYVFVHDPMNGPLARRFDPEKWTGVWVAPSVLYQDSKTVSGPTTVTYTPRKLALGVRGDDADIWNDWDGDGVVDFDETRRFGSSPFCCTSITPPATGSLVCDKDAIRARQTADWTAFRPRLLCGDPNCSCAP